MIIMETLFTRSVKVDGTECRVVPLSRYCIIGYDRITINAWVIVML